MPADRLTHAARRVLDCAIAELRRRDHSLLTSAHIFLALAQAEWELFTQAMRHAAVNPHDAVRVVDEHLRRVPTSGTNDVRVCPTTKLVCKLALRRAGRIGHSAVEARDLLLAPFDDTP